MKKLFFCAAIVAAAAFGVMKANNVNSNNNSDLQLKNVELTAEGECSVMKRNGDVKFSCVGESGECSSPWYMGHRLVCSGQRQ